MQLHKCLAELWLALARLVVMLFGLAVLIFLSPFQGLAISDRLVNASCDVAKQLAKGCTLLIVCICLIFKLVVIDCWPASPVKNALAIFGWVLRGRSQTTFTRRGKQVVQKCPLFVNGYTIENVNAGGQVVKESQIL